jgi:hypothetical protein
MWVHVIRYGGAMNILIEKQFTLLVLLETFTYLLIYKVLITYS